MLGGSSGNKSVRRWMTVCWVNEVVMRDALNDQVAQRWGSVSE